MKWVALVIAILTWTVGLCSAEGFELSAKAEHYTAKVAFLDGQPASGPNRVSITILDAGSRPVKDARVEIEYLMPSLPGKPPMMDYHATAKKVDSAYEATLNLDMKGEWRMVVSISGAKRTEKATVGFVIR